jgi:FtsP/CotA-like multicopper oxidase with cupredoxin domain
MTITRRTMLGGTLVAGASLVATRAPASAAGGAGPVAPPHPATAPGRVVVPNGSLLPWTIKAGVKVFHLRAEPVHHQIAPGLDIEAWGYNGVTPGPVLEAIEGERVRVYVTNPSRPRSTGTACSCRTGWTASPVSRSPRSHLARRSATTSSSIAPERSCITRTPTR